MTQPTILATDLEGVLVPEIWIAVAERAGIERLRLTTRDIPDYDELMRGRLALLREHRLTLADIQRVIGAIDPLPGAVEALARLRERVQVIILSDTYYEFAVPLMAKLGWPTLFCHSLEVDEQGMISNYRLRLPDSKTAAVRALRELRFRVLAVGDSYNDVGMLAAADAGALFEPPQNIVADFPHFPVLRGYNDLLAFVEQETQR
ncbi:bifunctional phosphoserine phosphatase/homoserine phosphotransferase ThrH [Roseiflexus castenholzii]|jgi:phosphoserine/homoserine phosphotransferase|uniref:phosphoserine phosphatase n=1 Tax=Roseiflexus castenholzii (strain DSM 13941 / HLO8) TaxID=383372 RepID=A7NNX1_ROSCS|nr:bifunctional phosphoserine phosphatase/homoserine phosphotransferase ThrH [Roseiflexus castenholzii]ABU59265.1 phosphoserine phosphatase/homoserine phosphotransferase bifunctional protein [Roseiflexus castenholzii DSM 13941]